ncbi:hypothetical protein DUNSADRAFT_16684 [Dunaliella salina]|uniref:Uncharacterized protein n=1 Tax=Dunaliella salina TaxID=3046 RepID=A0ABQ7H0R5_DUNSA|nr:hypothetical protein DUNSADRAFT_16684 [Dunaliella salina]|eukprot:KAF5840447.1 hypothetical protein DUNSADRAFT_16684 [Dunaliella salina]
MLARHVGKSLLRKGLSTFTCMPLLQTRKETAKLHKSYCVAAMQGGNTPPVCLPDEAALFSLAKSYPEAYLLVGYSEKALFESVEGAVKALQPYFMAAEKRCVGKPFLLVYGGDPAHVPTIGAVVKELQQSYHCHVLALQSWEGEFEPWVQYVFIVQHEMIKKVVAGREVEVRRQLWGGTRNGELVGASRFYMGPEFYGRPAANVPGVITLTFFLGGGGISAEELRFADEYGAPWIYIPCPAGQKMWRPMVDGLALCMTMLSRRRRLGRGSTLLSLLTDHHCDDRCNEFLTKK